MGPARDCLLGIHVPEIEPQFGGRPNSNRQFRSIWRPRETAGLKRFFGVPDRMDGTCLCVSNNDCGSFVGPRPMGSQTAVGTQDSDLLVSSINIGGGYILDSRSVHHSPKGGRHARRSDRDQGVAIRIPGQSLEGRSGGDGRWLQWRLRVPDSDLIVCVSRDELTAIGTPAHRIHRFDVTGQLGHGLIAEASQSVTTVPLEMASCVPAGFHSISLPVEGFDMPLTACSCSRASFQSGRSKMYQWQRCSQPIVGHPAARRLSPADLRVPRVAQRARR